MPTSVGFPVNVANGNPDELETYCGIPNNIITYEAKIRTSIWDKQININP